MRSIFFNQTGDPLEVLTAGEFEKPAPGPGEVLVKVFSSPINPADFLFIQGKYRFKLEFPQIAGLEAAGIIESVGESVSLKAGAFVAFFWRKTWSEYAIVPEEEAVVLPAGFPTEKAAQVALNPFTAWGLLERLDLRSGEWLLLTAGNSAVSRLLIQLASARGIKVIATVRDEKYAPGLASLGAEVINLAKEGVEQRVMGITAGKGVQGALDPVGGPAATEMLRGVAVNGKVIAYGSLSPEPFQVHNSQLVYKNISLAGFGVRGYLATKTREERAAMAAQLVTIIAMPDFRLDVAATYPMTDIKTAVQHAQQGGHGKILLTF